MNPEHVHLLATKWLDPKALSILVEREGLKYKKGKFSLGEQRSIHSALEAYKIVCLYMSPNALHLNVCVRGRRKRLVRSNRCSSRVMTKVATRRFGLNWASETLALFSISGLDNRYLNSSACNPWSTTGCCVSLRPARISTLGATGALGAC
jgi:hypothetical protein